jgi:hypothetical protein
MCRSIPSIFGITPTATYIATAQADEVCGYACVVALALQRIKFFDKRQQSPVFVVRFTHLQ